jgi:hypothetical protein
LIRSTGVRRSSEPVDRGHGTALRGLALLDLVRYSAQPLRAVNKLIQLIY